MYCCLEISGVLLSTGGNRRYICKQAEDIMMGDLITQEEIIHSKKITSKHKA